MGTSAIAALFALACWNIKKYRKGGKQLYCWIFIAGVLVGAFSTDTAINMDMLKNILENLPQ